MVPLWRISDGNHLLHRSLQCKSVRSTNSELSSGAPFCSAGFTRWDGSRSTIFFTTFDHSLHIVASSIRSPDGKNTKKWFEFIRELWLKVSLGILTEIRHPLALLVVLFRYKYILLSNYNIFSLYWLQYQLIVQFLQLTVLLTLLCQLPQ